MNHVIQSRKISCGYFVKLGIDGGKGFHKLCLRSVDTALRDESSSLPQNNLSLKGLAKTMESRDKFLLRYQKICQKLTPILNKSGHRLMQMDLN